MAGPDTSRDPCPDRIIDDIGGAFGMGVVGGFMWHFVQGARHSPVGSRWSGGYNLATTKAPITGSHFAQWGCVFTCSDCVLLHFREKDDHWNKIAAGFLTGGILKARSGFAQASRQAVIGGVFLAIIEGAIIFAQNRVNPTPREIVLQSKELVQSQASTVPNNASDINTSRSTHAVME